MDYRFPTAFFANGIGDTFLNLPALRALAQLFPKRLTLITQAGSHELCLEEVPFRRVIEVEMSRVNGARQFQVEPVLKAVGKCDLFLSLVPWSSASLEKLVAQLGPSRSVGFFPPNKVVLPLDYQKHSADLAFDIPRWVDDGLRLETFAQPPVFPASATKRARKLRQMLPKGSQMLAVHVETLPEKSWPIPHLRQTLDEFLTIHPEYYAFVFWTRPQHIDSARNWERIIPVCELPRATALALAAQADLFLGVDSCILHVADFCRIPGIGLFGPTAPQEFGFRLGPHIHLSENGKMDRLLPAKVVAALNELVRQKKALKKRHALEDL